MVFKLNQQPVAGESFVRCRQVIIDNHLGKLPKLEFHQETVIVSEGGRVAHMPMPPLSTTFDPAAEIPVINPETGEATGEIVTQAHVYGLVYSAYLMAATPPATNDEEMPQ